MRRLDMALAVRIEERLDREEQREDRFDLADAVRRFLACFLEDRFEEALLQ